jgi:hypothetical protein
MECTITVHPDSVISEMDMAELLTELEEFDDTSKMTDDMAKARRWVAEKRSHGRQKTGRRYRLAR